MTKFTKNSHTNKAFMVFCNQNLIPRGYIPENRSQVSVFTTEHARETLLIKLEQFKGAKTKQHKKWVAGWTHYLTILEEIENNAKNN